MEGTVAQDIERMAAHTAGTPFSPESIPATGEDMKSFLRAAEKYKIDSLNFSSMPFESGTFKLLAKHLGEHSGLKELNIRACNVAPEILSELLKQVGKSNVERLDISQNPFNADEKCTTELLNLIAGGKLKSLKTDFNRMPSTFFERLPPLLKTSGLEELSCQAAGCGYDGAEMGRILPETKLRRLDISLNRSFSQDALISIARNLPDSGLEFYAAHGIPLQEQAAIETCKGVKASRITETMLTFGRDGTDAERRVAEALADLFRSPETRLEKAVCELPGWDDENRRPVFNSRMGQMQRLAFREGYRKKTDEGAKLPFNPALSLAGAFDAGQVPQFLAARKTPLSAGDCLERTADGKTFAENAGKAELLSIVFSEKRWKDAKEMQNAWDAVPAEHRWQLDGRNERASFQTIKNKVMRSAVAEMLMKNKGKGLK